jgi:hypothetical protein
MPPFVEPPESTALTAIERVSHADSLGACVRRRLPQLYVRAIGSL